MTDQDPLKPIRERIDAIDAELLTLISERARCAQDVARVKREAQPGEDVEFYRPEREAQILRKVLDDNPGPLSGEEMARLFREIMSACLALEQPLNIAFLGPEGTFTQAAAYKHFGHSVTTTPLGAIDEVFREVESGGCPYGVVPIENSTEGVVNHTLDMFMQSPLKICGEVEMRIHHHLLGRGIELEKVERVYSHAQSLAQCREWLDANLPHAERVDVKSNAEAARRAAKESGAAAIAGETAAELYELEILYRNIEDQPDNTTRFLVIGRQAVAPSGQDKTSLLVSTSNRPGSLYRLLEPLASAGVSMTRIESRPSHCVNWDYVFFFDVEGHAEETRLKAALDSLRKEAELVKVLGSYPHAVL
jgi:chorismate mutase/prephenate dehydratase